MANITAICARSPDAKEPFIKRVGLEPPPFAGLSTGRTDLGVVSVCWEVASETFLNTRREGALSVFSAGDPGRDDLFLSVSENGEGVVSVRTDLLGLFPVYYYSTPDVLIFSSKPSVFRLYPGFRAQLDIEGLVGILLVSFIVGGQTLLKGVKRLSPGHALFWRPGETAQEVKSGMLASSDRYFGNSFEKNLAVVDGFFEAAVRRGRPAEDPVLLFSGGLDSRLIAGYLHQIHGRRVHALTQGNPGDFEMTCARRVVRALRWSHHIEPADPATFSVFARLKLEYEHLAHGFATPYFMQLVSAARSLGPMIYAGVHGDSALGFGAVGSVADPKTGAFTFEAHLKHLNRSGLPVETLRKLIPEPLLKDSLDNVIEKLRSAYRSLPGEPFQRAWLFDLSVADRLQVGFIHRMLSFGAWPRLPFVDGALLEAAAGMPYEAVAGRRMEKELVCRKFPKLAVLPLDRNCYDLSPVIGLKRMLKKNDLPLPEYLRALRWHCEGKFFKWAGEKFPKRSDKERRFYYRTFDVNGEAWVAFRREVEPCRRAVEAYLDPKTLGRLWPGPSETIRVKDGIKDTQSFKVLSGLSLWIQNNL